MKSIIPCNILGIAATSITILTWLCGVTASAATGHCPKDGDLVTVIGHTTPYTSGDTLELATPLCVQDPSVGNQVDSLTIVGTKLRPGVEMRVRGTLHSSKTEMGFEISVEAAGDAYAEQEALYEGAHGANALSTCLQWQQDSRGSITNGTSLLFQPECGIKTRDNPQESLSEKIMPMLGEGFATAQKIIDNAIAHRDSPTEPFDECGQWQTLVRNALMQSDYPASPNSTKGYFSPRCGIRLSNTVTREHVYLWLPASLAPISSTAENEKHLCIAQKRNDGVDAYEAIPCVVLDLQHVLHGASITSIDTSPAGALLSVNENVIAQTPALVIFVQPGSLATTVRVHVSRNGFQEGSVSFSTTDVVHIKLTRNPQ